MAQAPPPPPTLVTHAQRNLPTTTSITPCACCPTRDLLALLSSPSASPSASTSSTNDASTSTSNSGRGKLSLYRTTGQIDHVWEFAPSPSPSPSTVTVTAAVAPTAPVSKFAAFGQAKAKAKAVQVGIDAMAWSPDGHHLAVLSSSSPLPGTTLSNLEIVALHQPTPKSLLPPTSIPWNEKAFSKPSHLAWHPLTTVKKPEPSPENLTSRRPPHPEWTYRPLRSSAQALIAKLPALPDLNAFNASTALIGATDPNSSSGSGSVAAGTGGGPGAARAAIFGAKNAMLQKEREKDMGKPLLLNEAAPRFPTLLEESRVKGEQGEGSVLVVGQGGGKVTIYYGGSVMLGTVDVGEGLDQVQVHGSTTLPWDETQAGTALRNPPRGTFRISLLVSSNDPADPTSRDWRDRQINFDLPPTLHLLMTQSTELHRHISHAFEALQSVRTLWDEARRLGKSWLSRISEMSKAHTITTSPITQLLLLLLTGRPSAALHDFLASKMNEKSLSKWQGSMAQVLQRLKSVPYMSLQPAIERTVLLLEEVESWAMWKEKWGAFGLELGEVRRCLRLGTGVVKACARLERVVVEEERCFEAFGAWLHYELEKVAAQEGSEIVPIANFTPLPVAYYIRHCLPVEVNSILPFLNFGPFSASLDTNVDLIRAKKWIDELEVIGKRGKTREEGEEELRNVLKRMKEELKGQITAERVEATAEDWEGTVGGWDKEGLLGAEGLEPPSKPRDDAMGDDVVPPTAPGSANKAKLEEDDISVSLPILLHLLAGRVARIMDQAITAVGAPRVQEKPVVNPESSGVEVITRTSRERVLYREQTVRNDVWRVWIDGEVFRVVKTIYSTYTEASNIQLGALARLVDERDCRLEVIDLAWLDLDELVMICRIHEGKVTSHYLLSVCMSALSFEPLTSNPCRVSYASLSVSTGANPAADTQATPIQDSPTQRIPLHRTLLFEPQFPPEGLSIQPYREEEDGSTCRSGAPVACVLAGDGRRLQMAVIEGGLLENYDEEGDEKML